MLVLDAWSFGLFVPVEINKFKQSLFFLYDLPLYHSGSAGDNQYVQAKFIFFIRSRFIP